MSYCTPTKTLTARLQHRCTYCGEPILPGETYLTWASVDGQWFTNKMHPECLDDLREYSDPDGEYTLYGGERPKAQGGDQ